MNSDQPKAADNTEREPRERSVMIIVSLFMLMSGVAPLLNALGNPAIQVLHALLPLYLHSGAMYI